MAVQRRNNWVSQQRVDVPDIRSIESAVSNDFDQLLQGFILSNLEGYVLRGFDIVMTGAIGGAASGLQMNVSNAALLHPFSSQSGTFFVVPPGTPVQILNSAVNTQVSGAFTPSSQNFVGIEYARNIDDTTAAQVYIWDPTINDETTSVIPRANILNFQVVISTGTWAQNVLPIAIITTDAGNNVISVEDTRRMLFRLGTAGRTAPSPFYSYPWTAQAEGRTESPFISSSNSTNPFHGGDKMLFTEKDWKDAVMTKFKEVTGSAFWYSAGSSNVSGVNLTDMFFDSSASTLTMRGRFVHSQIVPGQLSWSGDLHIHSLIGPLFFLIPPNTVTLNDGQVGYVSLVRNNNFQPTNIFTFNNGSASVVATTLIANIFAGDWIKFFSDDMAKWAQVLSVVGNTITLTAPYVGTSASGIALKSTGSYTMQVADPINVPASGDTYWIAKRDDNGGITATIAVPPTGAVRVGGITTFTTTGSHGIHPGEQVEVAGVTDTSFNGFYQVLSTPALNTFTVQNTGPDATSGNGTVNSTAAIYLRGIGAVAQGESSSDVTSAIGAIIQYIGSPTPSDTQPQYASTNYVTQGIDLTTAISQLDAQAGTGTLISEQDRNLKLVRGGTWNFSNPTLSWSQDAFIQIPDLPENRNRIPAGNVTLSNDGDVAYVSVNRTAGSPANLTVSVAQISALVPNNNTLIIARKFGSGGIALGTLDGTLAQTNPNLGMFILSNTLYVSDSGILKIYDISGGNATAPVLLGSLAISNASRIIVVGTTAYVSGGSGGAGTLSIVDVTTPSAPSLTGTLTLSAGESIYKMAIYGTNAFISTFSGIPAPTSTGTLKIVDISVPATPVLTGTPITSGRVLSGGTLMQVMGTHLYEGSAAAGGRIYDISTPTTPTLANAYAPGPSFDWTQVLGTTWLVLDDAANTLYLYDLTAPAAPVLISSVATGTNSSTFYALGTHVYVSHVSPNILTIIDITVPAVPVSIYSGGTFTGFNIFANGNYVYTDVVLTGVTNLNILQGVLVAGFSTVIVGTHSFALVDGESKELDAGLSQQNRTAIGFSDEAQSSPAWQSSLLAPLRTIPADSTAQFSATASQDIEIDKFFGQMRLKAASPVSTRVIVTSSDVSMLTGEMRSQKISSLLLDFSGAQVDFSTGIVYKEDGITALGVNFTPVVIAANQYQWYSVSIIPLTSTSDGKLSGQLLILPGNGTGASAALAQKAPFPSNGIPLGQVVVRENGAGSAILNISQSAIAQLGIGSGSGSGTGDTTDFLTRMELWHDAAPYEFLTPAVFEVDIDTQTQSSSVPFDYASNSYKLATGQNWVSKQRLDDEFLTEAIDVVKVEAALIYNSGFADPNPTLELSRDGGVNFQSFPVQRLSPSSDTWRGELVIAAEPTQSVVSTYAVGNANTVVDLDASTDQQWSQPFVLSATQVLEKITSYVNKLGSPAGNLFIRLVRDDGFNKPSLLLADILMESAPVSIGGIASGNSAVVTNIPTTVLAAGQYHLVYLTDLAYKSSYSLGVTALALRADNTSPPAPYSTFFNGSIWTINTGVDLTYLIEGRILDLRLRVVSSITSSQLAAVGVLYNHQQSALGGIKNREVFVFDGTTNPNTFTITTFLPDPDLLMVFEAKTGQVYVNGSFSISGGILTFPVDTFNKPGESVTLIAVQPLGNSFDNNDRNAALLAANNLGSTDPSIDHSQNGRGIFLRRPDGTLREITIDDNDNIQVWSV